jgi:hypothetical protein
MKNKFIQTALLLALAVDVQAANVFKVILDPVAFNAHQETLKSEAEALEAGEAAAEAPVALAEDCDDPATVSSIFSVASNLIDSTHQEDDLLNLTSANFEGSTFTAMLCPYPTYPSLIVVRIVQTPISASSNYDQVDGDINRNISISYYAPIAFKDLAYAEAGENWLVNKATIKGVVNYTDGSSMLVDDLVSAQNLITALQGL